jgi:hypothetical protein
LLRRRKHYIHEYARILNKLKFRERVVRELLRRPGGVAVVDWHEHRQELEQIREKRQSQGGMLKGKEKRLLEQVDMMNVHQKHLDECQLLFFSFQFEIHARAVIHIQKIWRGCVTRPPFYIARYQSRLALASAFVALYKIPWLQPNIKYRIELNKRQLFLKRRKASFCISFTMKRHLRIMKTLRYVHPLLDAKIILHKKKIKSAKYLQNWWREYTEKAGILKRALAYSANLRAAQAERERSVGEQERHEAAKILQEWTGHIMILKHKYAAKIFCSLHQTMRNRLKHIDMEDTYQSDQLLRRLMDEDVEKQTQQHLAHVLQLQHVVETKSAPSRARGRARVEEEGYVTTRGGRGGGGGGGGGGGPEDSIVLDANEFPSDGQIPATVLPYTGLFPNLDPDHILLPSELSGTKWNFWIGIERLNKELWIPELIREDKELNVMARSLITWYIGENEPVVQKLSTGRSLSTHKYLAPLKRMYKLGTLLPGGGTATAGASNGALNHFVWFPPELMCPQCSAFLEESTLPDGKCGQCGLPPHYTRVERKRSRMGNRYHVTTSYMSLRLDVDLLVIHAMFRAIALRSHYAGSGRSVPVYEAWNMAISESKPIISKLLQYGCTKMKHLPNIPLTSIGVPGKTVLLLRNILWHINNVLTWAKTNSPYEMTMHPPPRDLQWIIEEEKRMRLEVEATKAADAVATKSRRPKTAPVRTKRRGGRSSSSSRPRTTSGGIRSRSSRSSSAQRKSKSKSKRSKSTSKMAKNQKKKRPKTSPAKRRHRRARVKELPLLHDSSRLGVPYDDDDDDMWFDAAALVSPPRRYKRPSTAPKWVLGGALEVRMK